MMVTDELREIVARALGLPPDAVTGRLSRDTEPAWDSFNHLMLVSAVEAELGVVLTMQQIASIRSVEDLAAIVAAAGSRRSH